MKKKWSFCVISTLLIIALSFSCVFAANEKFSFVLTADEQEEALVPTGEKVNIKLAVINNEIEDNTSYDLYSIQDYITYDRDFFDIDEESISVMQVSSSGQAVNLFGASAVSFDGEEPDRVYVNRSSTTAQNIAKKIDVVSFDLIVKATSGESIISHNTIEMLSPDLERYTYKTVDTKVIVGEPEPVYYAITASDGIGGNISPSGEVSVEQGENQTFAIAANRNYKIKTVTVDGVSIGAVSTYTFENVTANHTISATFESTGGGGSGGGGGGGGGGTTVPSTATTYKIATTDDEHGNTKPNLSVSESGKTITVSSVADQGYRVESVKVTDKDGNPVTVTKAADGSYVFIMPSADVTVEAVYAQALTKPVNPDETGVSGILQTKDHIRYINGYEDATVRPDANMTRAEAAQMFYNLLLDKASSSTNGFDDVAQEAWYYAAVNKLTSLGIIKGYDDTHFGPDDNITREQFCAIATRFTNLKDVTETKSFSDVTADMWSYNNIISAASMGWINGFDDGTFKPVNNITRAEVVTIVNHMLGRYADKFYVDAHANEFVKFTDLQNNSAWYYYDIVEASAAHDFSQLSDGEQWIGLR